MSFFYPADILQELAWLQSTPLVTHAAAKRSCNTTVINNNCAFVNALGFREAFRVFTAIKNKNSQGTNTRNKKALWIE